LPPFTAFGIPGFQAVQQSLSSSGTAWLVDTDNRDVVRGNLWHTGTGFSEQDRHDIVPSIAATRRDVKDVRSEIRDYVNHLATLLEQSN
jgi:hypothetical protein